jgi:hypothetical protein
MGAVLLQASHRLAPAALRNLATVHPGECIVILEKHPESRLRQALKASGSNLPQKVASALATMLTPGG